MQSSKKISRITILPSPEDYAFIKSKQDKTATGPYEVTSVLKIPSIKGTFNIKFCLSVAIKSIYNDIKNKQGYQKDVLVSRILARQPSANIVQFYRIQEVPHRQNNEIEKVFIVMEKGRKTLVDCAKDDLQKKLKYIGDIAKGLDHLHNCGIVHRDMKAENVLISFAGVAKIFDFGASKYYGDIKQGDNFAYKLTQKEKEKNKIIVNTQIGIGTIQRNPPQILLDTMQIKTLGSCDMWQFGLIILGLIWPDIEKQAEAKTYRKHCEDTQDEWINNPKSKHKINLPPLQNLSVRFKHDKQLYDLVRRCFYYHPDQRITSNQFVKQFFQKVMSKPTKIEKKFIEILSITKNDVYVQPKQFLAYTNMKKQILSNFVDKCAKEFANVKGKDVEKTMNELIEFAKCELKFNGEKAKRLVLATSKLIQG